LKICGERGRMKERNIFRHHTRDHRDFGLVTLMRARPWTSLFKDTSTVLSLFFSLLLATGNSLAGRDVCPRYLTLSITSKHMVCYSLIRNSNAMQFISKRMYSGTKLFVSLVWTLRRAFAITRRDNRRQFRLRFPDKHEFSVRSIRAYWHFDIIRYLYIYIWNTLKGSVDRANIVI